MDYSKQHNNPLYIAFIDLKAAFDTADMALLWDKLKQLGMSPNFIATIKNLYKNTQRKVWWNNKLMNTFQSRVGLHKGCPLSMLLFIILTADIPQDLDRVCVGVTLTGIKITSLSYADDIVIATESQTDMGSALLTLTKMVEQLKLEIHEIQNHDDENRNITNQTVDLLY